VITPAYSTTATERVLPRMALDFTTGTLDPRVTVTRALNTATAINSSGFIAIVNANLPRFDYNPNTLAPRGLLIEEARTNLFIQSQFQGNWTANAGTTTFLGTYVTSPDGTSNGRILNDTSAAAAAYVFQGVSFTSGTVYTLSVYVKKGVSRYLALTSFTQSGRALFDLNNYSLSSVTGIVTSATITSVGGGWYRCTATMTASATGSNNLGFGDFEAGPTGDLYYIWGAQVEAGAFATSYIPTTTTSLTRNRDDVSMTGANFSSWYQAGSGTLQAIMTRYPVATGFPRLVSLSDNTVNNEIAILNFNPSAGVGVGVTNGGATQASTFISLTGNEENMAFRFGTNDFALSLNSSAVTTDTSGTVPTVSQMLIGTGPLASSPVCNGWYKKIFFFNNKLISNELRSVSKL
jgi:hypothetical protein